ncbi:hypothetical protein BV22DRAFT_1134104 [Leucogyrophana mollusca]|uniref:Uncharacterized protein n=1 Tax=Leucogyrophana mollusca TaxID=85980 RepID=A0ACB8B0L4_9AGAM|nr:hypothetical protein BV22DRAFT_1134104 [Leucogyrophana mollusca]
MSTTSTPVPTNTTADGPSNAIVIPSSPVNVMDNDAKLWEMKRQQDEEFKRKRQQLCKKQRKEVEEQKAYVAEQQVLCEVQQ